MKRSSRRSLGLAAGLAVATLAAAMSVSAQTTSCDWGGVAGAGRIQHFDKIIFRPIKDKKGNFRCPAGSIDPNNASPLIITNSSVMDIKVTDDTTRVADVQAKVAGFLNSVGCEQAAGGPIPASRIEVLDVEYATECVAACPCAETYSQVIFTVSPSCIANNPPGGGISVQLQGKVGLEFMLVSTDSPTPAPPPICRAQGTLGRLRGFVAAALSDVEVAACAAMIFQRARNLGISCY